MMYKIPSTDPKSNPRSVTAASTLFQFAYIFVSINLLLMLFNLIPISPLDGEKVLSYFLPPSGQALMARIRPYGPILLMGIIFLFRGVLEFLIFAPLELLRNLLLG